MPVLRATLDHLELLVPLFDGYRCFYKQNSDSDGARKFLKSRLEEGSSVIFMALSDSSDASALGFTQLFPLFSSVSMQHTWLLNDLYVAPEGRRSGSARHLMAAAADFARADGAKGLELETQKDNAPAKALYDSLGWDLDLEHDHYSLVL